MSGYFDVGVLFVTVFGILARLAGQCLGARTACSGPAGPVESLAAGWSEV